MGDEFKKAIEEAMKQMEEEEKKGKTKKQIPKPGKSSKRKKTQTGRFSASQKRSMK